MHTIHPNRLNKHPSEITKYNLQTYIFCMSREGDLYFHRSSYVSEEICWDRLDEARPRPQTSVNIWKITYILWFPDFRGDLYTFLWVIELYKLKSLCSFSSEMHDLSWSCKSAVPAAFPNPAHLHASMSGVSADDLTQVCLIKEAWKICSFGNRYCKSTSTTGFKQVSQA